MPAGDSQTILVVDDDRSIRDTVSFALNRAGFNCDEAEDGAQALACFNPDRHALVVLDISMPGGPDGLEVCRQLHARSKVPVIFLSALDEETDRVVGLELGGTDYVTKPFSARELVARVKAVLRLAASSDGQAGDQQAGEPCSAVSHGRLRLDESTHRVFWDDTVVDPSPSGFRLLAALIRRPEQVLSRDQLMDYLGDGAVVEDRTIDSHVSNLREAIKSAGCDNASAVVETVRGMGYRLGECR
jgi:two-component system OmpR family response regulator